MAYRALVVEDDGVLADVLRMKLEREGHEVIIAPSQRDAYHLLDDQAFDFALLDLRLPTHAGDMDPHSQVGFDVLVHIRERFAADKLPVIVMTAYEETSQTAVRALRAGANDYITKPFDDSPISLDEKLREIASCISQARRMSAEPRSTASGKAHRVVFLAGGNVEVDGMLIPRRSADLLRVLATQTLTLPTNSTVDPDPRMPGKMIARALGVEEPTVRQYVKRFRESMAAEYQRRNLGSIDNQAIVRNARTWKGYDLNREACELSLG
jgi:DNA-binding response OmpR family regulator